MLSLKKREIKSFIYFTCNLNVTLYYAARYPVCMITDYADSLLWRRCVSLTASGEGKAWLRELGYGWDDNAVL